MTKEGNTEGNSDIESPHRLSRRTAGRRAAGSSGSRLSYSSSSLSPNSAAALVVGGRAVGRLKVPNRSPPDSESPKRPPPLFEAWRCCRRGRYHHRVHVASRRTHAPGPPHRCCSRCRSRRRRDARRCLLTTNCRRLSRHRSWPPHRASNQAHPVPAFLWPRQPTKSSHRAPRPSAENCGHYRHR